MIIQSLIVLVWTSNKNSNRQYQYQYNRKIYWNFIIKLWHIIKNNLLKLLWKDNKLLCEEIVKLEIIMICIFLMKINNNNIKNNSNSKDNMI